MSEKSNSKVPEVERFRLYEFLKRLIRKRTMTPDEYEEKIKQIADALGV